jgi:hypothetical protein
MKFWIALIAATAGPFALRACLLSPIIAPAALVQQSESQPHSFLLRVSFGYGVPRDGGTEPFAPMTPRSRKPRDGSSGAATESL